MLVALHGPIFRAMSDQNPAAFPEHCLPELHRWRPVAGNPIPLSAFDGQRCYCGLRILTLHACECGHQHLRQLETASLGSKGVHDG